MAMGGVVPACGYQPLLPYPSLSKMGRKQLDTSTARATNLRRQNDPEQTCGHQLYRAVGM